MSVKHRRNIREQAFCENLKRIRERSRVTQNELEVIAELPIGVVSFYETGVRSPGIENLTKLCAALKCTADELLFPTRAAIAAAQEQNK